MLQQLLRLCIPQAVPRRKVHVTQEHVAGHTQIHVKNSLKNQISMVLKNQYQTVICKWIQIPNALLKD